MKLETPKITVAIPLFKSARFIDNILENIENIRASNVEILISDRHCYDNTIDRLAYHFKNDKRVRCLKNNDKIDWVGNINTLLREAKGKYWQFLPHDDINPPGILDALVEALDANADAVLAYGPFERIDINGRPIQVKGRPLVPNHPENAQNNWNFGLALSMFWEWYFAGSFKGLVRREIVITNNQLFVRSTKDQILPERCWLFALSLLGEFLFVPEAKYKKRIYQGSCSSKWKIQGSHFISAARVMRGYLDTLVDTKTVNLYGSLDLIINARRLAWWQDNQCGKMPSYIPAPHPQSEKLRHLSLPYRARQQGIP